MERFENVIQSTFHELGNSDHPLKGSWNTDFFKNEFPIIIELGCGKGEYTTGLAELNSTVNYIGIDIKGSRMWKGAKHAIINQLTNVAFLRTHIEMIGQFFGKNEISEIWLTFPDPQMKKTRKRLTSTRFIELYRQFLKPEGKIHLKTDSSFQYQYTYEMAKVNNFKIVENNNDIYAEKVNPVLEIKTYYEKQWIARGLKIKYISFIPHQNNLVEPEVDIEPDSYRSFGRGAITVE